MRLLTSTNALLQGDEPTASQLQAAINTLLKKKDAILNKLKMADHLDGQEFQDEIACATKISVTQSVDFGPCLMLNACQLMPAIQECHYPMTNRITFLLAYKVTSTMNL